MVFPTSAVWSRDSPAPPLYNRRIMKSRAYPKIYKRCGSALESLGYSSLVKGGSGYFTQLVRVIDK
jgi:hypothetical protein